MVHSINMITGFSTWPLQAASVIGFFFTVVGTLVLLFVLVRYAIYGGVVPGFSFLASMIAIFSGAQLFALGIIGEYLARMHMRSMQHPVYSIRQIAQHETAARGEEALAGAAARPQTRGR